MVFLPCFSLYHNKNRFLSLILFIIFSPTASAYTLQGTVVTADREAMPGASVVLFAVGNDSVPVAGTSCNEQGAYLLQADGGTYRLRASFIGMKTAWHDVTLSQDTRLDTIVMQTDTLLTQEVTVTAHFIKHEPNSITIAMQGNPLARNSSAYDMLYKLPGMYGLTIYGRAVSKIYIDDQEIPADIATAMMQTIRAEDIESFELIPIAGVEYDATTEGSVLRIKLKKKREDGAIITLQTQEKYPYEGKSIDSNPSVYAMAQLGKVESVSFVGFTNKHSWPYHNESTRTYNNGAIVESQSNSTPGNKQNQIQAMQSLRYNINKRHAIGGRFHFTWHDDGASYRETVYTQNTTTLQFPDKTENFSTYFLRVFSGYAFYQWNIDNRGSFLKVDIQYNNSSQRDIDSENSYYDNNVIETFYDNTPLSNSIIYPQILFKKRFSNDMILQAGFKYLRTTGAMQQTQINTISSSQEESATNDYFPYNFTENLYTTFAQLSGSLWKKRLSYQVGVNVQHVDTRHRFSIDDPTTRFRSTGVFPTASLQYNFDTRKGHFLSLSYSPFTNYPTGYNLNATLRRTGTYNYYYGNPNLKAPYNHRLQLQQTLWNSLTLAIGGNWTINPIAARDSIGADHQTRYRTLENFGSYYSYAFGIFYNKALTRWLHINTNGIVRCDYENSRQYGKHTYWTGSIYLRATASLPYDWDISLGASFTGEQRQYNNIRYPHVGGSLSVTKSCLNKNLVAGLYLNNLLQMDGVSKNFYTDYYTTNRNSYIFNIALTLRYTFNIGKKDIKVREVQTDNSVNNRIQQQTESTDTL